MLGFAIRNMNDSSRADVELVAKKLRVRAADVAYLRAVLEAYEGIACIVAERGGDLSILYPPSRTAELEAVVEELAREFPMHVA